METRSKRGSERVGKEHYMSVSKWAYTPEKCDGKPCVGDCDLCSKAYEDDDEELSEPVHTGDA